MKSFFVTSVVLLSVLAGCSNSGQQQAQSEQRSSTAVDKASGEAIQLVGTKQVVPDANTFQPFYVFLSKGANQNHYIPSGFMPNGNCISFTDTWQEKCQTGKTCVKIIYDIECSRADQKWAGVYWLNPANNWGTRKGGYNLTGAKKVTFWARGEKGGEQIQEITVGGVSGDYPDSDTAVIGPIILGTQWREYTIDLRGKDLSYISGGFSWTTSEEVNPEDCTFYLDNIRFE
jgi:hypothetical protein